MTPRQAVSVIIPVFNGEAYLGEAVSSARVQDPRPHEILVVDDGSTHGTARVVRQLGPGLGYHFQDNAGPSAARNRGIELSSGDFLAFLDADDCWPHGKFRAQLARFQQAPELDVVLGRIQFIGDPNPGDHEHQFDGPDRTVSAVNLGSGLFRRRVFERVGGFDPSLRSHEDHDWFLRARELRVQMVILEQVTLWYRRHPDSLSQRQQNLSKAGMLTILQRSLARRRRLNEGRAPSLRSFTDHRDAPPGER
jgi:glycosyltransferase involved in cell wall biosynthesis